MPDLSRRAFASALPFGLLGGGLIHSAQAIAATPEPVATLARVVLVMGSAFLGGGPRPGAQRRVEDPGLSVCG